MEFTVIIKRNAGYEKGMYGLSTHDQPGGAGNVEPIISEAQLRERLIGFGFSEDRSKGVIESLKNKNDSVRLNDVATRILAREKTVGGVTYTCDHCSWCISMSQEDNAKAEQLFTKHVCTRSSPLFYF
jgi:hypothetical protein